MITDIDYYISDFNRILLSGFYPGRNIKYYGLARVDITEEIPRVELENGDYEDCLFNDNYDATCFWLETGDREQIAPNTFTTELDLVIMVKKLIFGDGISRIMHNAKKLLQVTGFQPTSQALDELAVDGFNFDRTIHPYAAFKLTGTLKVTNSD